MWEYETEGTSWLYVDNIIINAKEINFIKKNENGVSIFFKNGAVESIKGIGLEKIFKNLKWKN